MHGVLCGNGTLVREWTLQGRGVAVKALTDVIDDLEAGRLVPLPPGHHGGAAPVQALLPGRGHTPQRVREQLVPLAERCAVIQRRMDRWSGRRTR